MSLIDEAAKYIAKLSAIATLQGNTLLTKNKASTKILGLEVKFHSLTLTLFIRIIGKT